MRIYLLPGNLKKVCKAGILLLLLISSGRTAQANTLEDDLDPFAGFDDLELISPEPNLTHEDSYLDHFSGYTKCITVANITHQKSSPSHEDWYGLSSLKLEFVLEASFRLGHWKTFASVKGYYDMAYEINGREDYSAEVLAAYEDELELWEAYIQGSPTDQIDLKIGRQIVVWGRSDIFRVTDILNPLDNREPGMVDIESLRLPLAMVKMDYFLKNVNLDLISIHQHQYDRNPPTGHYLYSSFAPLPEEEKPSHSLDNTEIAAALNATFTGWDLSFYGAHGFNDNPTFTPTQPIKRQHQRVSMFGFSSSLAKGNILYSTEIAHFRGLKFMNNFQKEYSRTDFLVGIEYSGLPDTTISLDYVQRQLHDYDQVLDTSPEAPQATENGVGCRIAKTFMQDTLHLTTLLMFYGDFSKHWALQRFTAKYDMVDNWSVSGGLMFYQPGPDSMASNGDLGRIYLCEYALVLLTICLSGMN